MEIAMRVLEKQPSAPIPPLWPADVGPDSPWLHSVLWSQARVALVPRVVPEEQDSDSIWAQGEAQESHSTGLKCKQA